MHEGVCTAELEGDEISEEIVIAYAFGETPKKELQ
jgi:ribose transport system ATP-binding protein